MEREDCSSYLSIDNGKGLLLKKSDVLVLKHYGIDCHNYSNLEELIFMVGNYVDVHYDEDIDALEEVLSNLIENHYYTEIKK